MILRKVSISDRDIQRKHRTQTNCEVSYWRDEFDSDGYTAPLSYGKQKTKPNYGTNRKEWMVSQSGYVNGWKGRVNG